jgi:hypothetical protein
MKHKHFDYPDDISLRGAEIIHNFGLSYENKPNDAISDRPIINVIKKAYSTMYDRKWDSVYWAIDIHGVIVPPNYVPLTEQINADNVVKPYKNAIEVMRWILKFPETKIILWSSSPKDDIAYYKWFYFDLEGIAPNRIFINSNPEVTEAASGADFSSKFYFNILLDDKAGFDPDLDWDAIKYRVSGEQYLIGKTPF